MNEAKNCRDQLRELISQRLTPEHETWLNDQRGKDRAALQPVLSQMSRTVGTRALIGSIGGAALPSRMAYTVPCQLDSSALMRPPWCTW